MLYNGITRCEAFQNERRHLHRNMIYCGVSEVKMNLNWFSSSPVNVNVKQKKARKRCEGNEQSSPTLTHRIAIQMQWAIVSEELLINMVFVWRSTKIVSKTRGENASLAHFPFSYLTLVKRVMFTCGRCNGPNLIRQFRDETVNEITRFFRETRRVSCSLLFDAAFSVDSSGSAKIVSIAHETVASKQQLFCNSNDSASLVAPDKS